MRIHVAKDAPLATKRPLLDYVELTKIKQLRYEGKLDQADSHALPNGFRHAYLRFSNIRLSHFSVRPARQHPIFGFFWRNGTLQ